MQNKETLTFIKIARYVETTMQNMATKGKLDIKSLSNVINNLLVELETSACLTIVNSEKAQSYIYAMQVLSKGFELLLIETNKIENTMDVKVQIEIATSQIMAIESILIEYIKKQREDKIIITINSGGIKVI